jgi:hypothetical protein
MEKEVEIAKSHRRSIDVVWTPREEAGGQMTGSLK